jgi:hypothetical protein
MAKSKDTPAPGQLASLAMPASTYTLSGDVATVVDRVIARFPQKFGHLVNAKLACLKRQSKRSEDAFSVDGSGGSFIRSDRERALPNAVDGQQVITFDAGLWFRAKWWDGMTPDQRDAWVFHQLSHLHARPSGGGLVRVGHDVEAFADEPVHFGAWEEQLSLFERNLDEYTPGAALLRQRKDSATTAPPPVN